MRIHRTRIFAAIGLAFVLLAIIGDISRVLERHVPTDNKTDAGSQGHGLHQQSVDCEINGRIFTILATIGTAGLKDSDDVRTVIAVVGDCFGLLEWPEDSVVLLDETEDTFVVTWPLPKEIADAPIHKPDYTARAIIDKRTLKVLRILQG